MANPSMDRDLVAWLRGQLQEAHAASSRHVMELFVDPPGVVPVLPRASPRQAAVADST